MCMKEKRCELSVCNASPSSLTLLLGFLLLLLLPKVKLPSVVPEVARETCKKLGSGEYRKMTEVEDQQARYPPTYTSSVRGYVFAVFAVPPRTEGHLHQWSSSLS